MIKKVMLGRTGQMVSEMALGTMYMGSRLTYDISDRIISKYMEYGGSFIDTANNYAHWLPGCDGSESEKFLGQWFLNTGKRNEVFLATKVGSNNKYRPKSLKKEQIIDSCDQSLRDMNTNVIDLFYAHMDDRSTPIEEVLEAFESLRRQGKVRYLGASNFTTWRMEQSRFYSEAHQYEPYVCLQERFTYLRPRPAVLDRYHIDLSDDIMDYALDRGITLLAYSPLLQGFYTRPDSEIPPLCRGDFNGPRLAALRETAAELGKEVTLNQLVLKWMRSQSAEIIPLVSGDDETQLEENLKALEISLTDEQLDRLNNA